VTNGIRQRIAENVPQPALANAAINTLLLLLSDEFDLGEIVGFYTDANGNTIGFVGTATHWSARGNAGIWLAMPQVPTPAARYVSSSRGDPDRGKETASAEPH
jgi:hypothetical protein